MKELNPIVEGNLIILSIVMPIIEAEIKEKKPIFTRRSKWNKYIETKKKLLTSLKNSYNRIINNYE